MTNLWILTEERPKLSVIRQILTQYSTEYGATAQFGDSFNIKPIVVDNAFTFDYEVEGVAVSDIERITIVIVSGNSSFVDYMLVRQDEKPSDHSLENVLMAIEETKTSDAESRNTGVYQRASKSLLSECQKVYAL